MEEFEDFKPQKPKDSLEGSANLTSKVFSCLKNNRTEALDKLLKASKFHENSTVQKAFDALKDSSPKDIGLKDSMDFSHLGSTMETEESIEMTEPGEITE